MLHQESYNNCRTQLIFVLTLTVLVSFSFPGAARTPPAEIGIFLFDVQEKTKPRYLVKGSYSSKSSYASNNCISKDMTKILFNEIREGASIWSSKQTWFFDINTNQKKMLTDLPGYALADNWISDDNGIIFQGQRITERGTGEDLIYIMDILNNTYRVLCVGSHFALSPLKDRIVYQSVKKDRNWEIYSINIDGTDDMRLTQNNIFDTNPNYSCDGSKIAFVRDSHNKYIVIISSIGKELNEIVIPYFEIASGPIFSPNDDKLAFVGVKTASKETTEYFDSINKNGINKEEWAKYEDMREKTGDFKKDLFVFDLVTKKIEKITQENFDYLSEPSWSHDGKRIAAVGCKERITAKNTSIYVIDIEKGNVEKVYSDSYLSVSPPVWFSDNKRLLFLRHLTSEYKD